MSVRFAAGILPTVLKGGGQDARDPSADETSALQE